MTASGIKKKKFNSHEQECTRCQTPRGHHHPAAAYYNDKKRTQLADVYKDNVWISVSNETKCGSASATKQIVDQRQQ